VPCLVPNPLPLHLSVSSSEQTSTQQWKWTLGLSYVHLAEINPYHLTQEFDAFGTIQAFMFTLGVLVGIMGMLLLCPRAPPLQMETDEDINEDVIKSSSSEQIILAPLEHENQSPSSPRTPAPCTPALVRAFPREPIAGLG
jgi:hypothetical protein